jgi:hypothetical protein
MASQRFGEGQLQHLPESIYRESSGLPLLSPVVPVVLLVSGAACVGGTRGDRSARHEFSRKSRDSNGARGDTILLDSSVWDTYVPRYLGTMHCGERADRTTGYSNLRTSSRKPSPTFLSGPVTAALREPPAFSTLCRSFRKASCSSGSNGCGAPVAASH